MNYFKISIRPINGTLIGLTIPNERGLGSNSYEEVLPRSQSSRIGASPSDAFYCCTQDPPFYLTPVQSV